jgi:hypothetical protein
VNRSVGYVPFVFPLSRHWITAAHVHTELFISERLAAGAYLKHSEGREYNQDRLVTILLLPDQTQDSYMSTIIAAYR